MQSAQSATLPLDDFKAPWPSKTEACVEAGAFRLTDGGFEIRVRNSKNRGGPVVAFTPTEWEVFIGSAAGEFGLPPEVTGS